jgi:hypothetical protein
MGIAALNPSYGLAEFGDKFETAMRTDTAG